MTEVRLRRVALGSILFFLLAPGTVVGLVPYLVTRWKQEASGLPVVRAFGLALALIGLLSLLESFVRFVVRGHGTPAPVAPPTALVVTGQYRYVRNPMYLTLMLIVAGQAAWFNSLALLVYAVALWVLFHLRVVWYEEPRLVKLFGASFNEYQLRVPRWLPRPRP